MVSNLVMFSLNFHCRGVVQTCWHQVAQGSAPLWPSGHRQDASGPCDGAQHDGVLHQGLRLKALHCGQRTFHNDRPLAVTTCSMRDFRGQSKEVKAHVCIAKPTLTFALDIPSCCQGGCICNCGQIHRGICQNHSRDVWICQGAPTLHHLHGCLLRE